MQCQARIGLVGAGCAVEAAFPPRRQAHLRFVPSEDSENRICGLRGLYPEEKFVRHFFGLA